MKAGQTGPDTGQDGTLEVEVVKAVRSPVAPSFLRSVLRAAWGVAWGALPSQPFTSGSLSVRLTGDRELRRLNRQFLGIDEVTDVLSFPSGSPGYLGDIAVSWPAVVRQAALFGHAEKDELALLCVHGLLHLLGWEHETAEQERAMWEETFRCLAAAGVTVAFGRLPLRGGGLGHPPPVAFGDSPLRS